MSRKRKVRAGGRYRAHKLLLGAGVITYMASMFGSPKLHSLALVAAGVMLMSSGILGLSVARNIIIDVLLDVFEGEERDHSDTRRTLAAATSGVYLLLGLWWAVMGVWWWLG